MPEAKVTVNIGPGKDITLSAGAGGAQHGGVALADHAGTVGEFGDFSGGKGNVLPRTDVDSYFCFGHSMPPL